MKRLSVIIPCYNEEAILPKSIPLVLDALANLPVKTELIIVDDGSIDATSEKAKELLKNSLIEHTVYRYEKNKGKGAAVRTGVSLSSGDHILFFDIDLSTSLEALNDLMELLKKNDYPIIIGSRLLPESQIIKTQNIFRVTAGNLYRKLGIWILGLNVSDIGCGFKCFRKDIARRLFSQMKINRWSFDAEILYMAKLYNIPTKEIPVKWKNNPDSRLSLYRHGFASLVDIISIRTKQLR